MVLLYCSGFFRKVVKESLANPEVLRDNMKASQAAAT